MLLTALGRIQRRLATSLLAATASTAANLCKGIAAAAHLTCVMFFGPITARQWRLPGEILPHAFGQDDWPEWMGSAGVRYSVFGGPGPEADIGRNAGSIASNEGLLGLRPAPMRTETAKDRFIDRFLRRRYRCARPNR